MKVWYGLRSLLFYCGYILITVGWFFPSILFAWFLPLRARFFFVAQCWSGMILGWLRLTCGVRYVVEGRENIPAEPCVVLCRHESTLEILFLQWLFAPQATLLKQELMKIPFFGWGLRLARPIPIDRSDPRSALRTLIRVGQRRLAEGLWVVLFPEGTRLQHTERGRFQSGGAALAEASGRPLLVVSHDAGRYWPARAFVKYPGVVRVRIAPPIKGEGVSSKVLNQAAMAVMDAELQQLQRPDGERLRCPD
jgi:1-acyl-sn-glycerol-3-phosphate acyltransferase